MTGTDPRRRDDGLGWVTRAVFPDERVRLTLLPAGASQPALDPADRLLARYAVVPSPARARFLLPLGPRRVTAASVWAYNALRPLRVRLPRALLGLAARTGVLQVTRPAVLTVSAPGGTGSAGVPPAGPAGPEPAGQLTLLERKRLELSRALATGPRLLLLDEIAGGLTEAECHELVATIRGIRETGVSIIWIEHIVHALTAVVERLVVIDFGRIVAEGDPETVMKDPLVQEIYMGIAVDDEAA